LIFTILAEKRILNPNVPAPLCRRLRKEAGSESRMDRNCVSGGGDGAWTEAADVPEVPA
jgi:hypothetical protein